MPPLTSHCAPAPRVDVLVLDAGLRASLVAVRSLGRAGLRVAVAECASRWPAPATSSRYVTTAHRLPDADHDGPAYAGAVLALVRGLGPGLVLATHDGSVAALRTVRAALERDTSLALPSEAALDVFVDKQATLALAARLGLCTPAGRHVAHLHEVPAALAAVGLPAVVKPCESWVVDALDRARRVQCRDVVTEEELHCAVEVLLQQGGSALVQALLPGQREAVHVVAQAGEPVVWGAQATDRTAPPLGGNSVLRRSTRLEDDLAEATRALLKATSYTGYAEVEFRRTAQGRPALMELNPRLSASVEVAVRAGVDVPLLLWQQAQGQELVPFTAVRTDVRMRWLGGDLRWVVHSVKERGRPLRTSPARAAGMFLREFLRGDGLDYCGWGDPGPARAAVCGLPASVLARSRRSTS